MTEHDYFNESIIQEGESLLFRTLWNTTNDNMFIVKQTEDGEFISEKANNALLKTFNFGNTQLENIPLKDLIDANIYEKVKEKYQKCIDANKPFSYEEVHVIDLEERYWDTTIIPVYDDMNGITRIFGISREITQLKRNNEILETKVKTRTKELEDALRNIKKLSITDKLTNIYNRRYLDSTLENTNKLLKRYGTRHAVIIIDIDNFKNINDTYGHHMGDKILQELSSLLKNSIRATDVLGRWGGEEFMIIIPFVKEDSILKIANTFREKIEKYKFTTINNLTSSFGISLQKEDDTPESFIIRADIALYKAKRKGKNRVEIEF